MCRLHSYMYVARADSSCILNMYTLHGFSGQSHFFFFYIKNIESLILSQILSDSIVMAES